MKIRMFMVAAGVSLVMLSSAFSATETEAARPPGVAANEWVAINESLGIVLIAQKNPVARIDATALLLIPPTQGYFMIKLGDLWRRLEIVEPVRGPAAAG